MAANPSITEVRTWPVGTSWRNLLFVEVVTDAGIVGLGEATVEWFEEAVEAHANSIARRHVIGRDPFDVEDLVMQVLRNDYWPTNVVLNSALAGIEMACWDIMGQATDQPLHKLLGGAVRDRVPAYANGWYRAERNAVHFAAAAEAVVEKGYGALKLDPFGAGHLHLDPAELELALELVEGVRRAVGPEATIYVDAHGRFSAESATRVARALAPLGVGWLEEPVPAEALDALRQVAGAGGVAIASGERVFSPSQAEALLRTGAVAIFQPDPVHCGGLLQAKRLAALAERSAVPVALHDSGGPVATAACLHLHLSMPNALVQEVFDDFDEPWLFDLVRGAPRVRGGFLEAPQAPGLGVRLDHAVAAEHPSTPLDFHHWQEGWEQRSSGSSGAGARQNHERKAAMR